MKTTFHPRNKREPGNKRILIVLAVFIGVSLLLTVLDGLVVRIATPIWKTKNVVTNGTANVLGSLSSKHALVEENQKLKEEVLNYEALLATLRSVNARDESLMASLGRTLVANEVAAAVLTKPPFTPYDTLLIDAGTSDGVQIGSRVGLPDSSVIGSVTETFEHTSRVKLFSTSGEKTNAILERHDVPVIIEGQGGGYFKITLPRDMEVEPGDRILMPGIEARMLAVVEDVSLHPTDSFKEVLARSTTNIFGTRLVVVEK